MTRRASLASLDARLRRIESIVVALDKHSLAQQTDTATMLRKLWEELRAARGASAPIIDKLDAFAARTDRQATAGDDAMAELLTRLKLLQSTMDEGAFTSHEVVSLIAAAKAAFEPADR